MLFAISWGRELRLREATSCPQHESGRVGIRKRPAISTVRAWKERPASRLSQLVVDYKLTHEAPFRLLTMPRPSQPLPFPSPASLASSRSPYFLVYFSTTLPHLWPSEGIEPTQTHTSEGSPPNLNLLASLSGSVVTLPLVAFEAPQFSPNLPSGLVPVVGPPEDCIPKSPFSHFQDLPPGSVPPPGCSPWISPPPTPGRCRTNSKASKVPPQGVVWGHQGSTERGSASKRLQQFDNGILCFLNLLIIILKIGLVFCTSFFSFHFYYTLPKYLSAVDWALQILKQTWSFATETLRSTSLST